MSDIQFYVFDRWDNQKGIIADWIEAVHSDEVNGEDSVTIQVREHDLVKGDHLVWQDKQGTWHEHIVNGIEDTHDSEGVMSEIYAENSIAELFVAWNDDLRNQSTTAQVALEKALSGTRWQVGTVSVNKVASCNFYHQSARQSIADIIKNWGGELQTDIEVSGAHITARKVSILAQRGRASTSKRFEYDKDIQTLSREVSEDDIFTALYGYGKGLEKTDDDGNATGGYTRKLTFGDVNGGVNWTGDDAAKEKYGVLGADGKKTHAFGSVDFDDCEDATELLNLTKEALKTACKPKVSYTLSVINLADAGFKWEDCGVGDYVQIVDKVLDERLEGRVLGIKRFLKMEDASVITVGNFRKRITDAITEATSGLKSLSSRASQWDSVADASTPYIDAVMAKMNKMFNESGNSYKYESFEQGSIWASVPLDENGLPTKTPAMAIQINNQGFRIASGVKEDGTFDWRTFGSGSGFVANELVAGTITGGNSSWNLETGDFVSRFYIGDESVGSTDTDTFTWVYSHYLEVRMTSDTAFGVFHLIYATITYADGTSKTTLESEEFIGGISINDYEAHFRAARVGTSANNYITTGTTQVGYPGSTFHNSDGNYLSISALRPVDDIDRPYTDGATGFGLDTFNYGTFTSNTYFGSTTVFAPKNEGFFEKSNASLWLYDPEHSQTKPYRDPVASLSGGTFSYLRVSDNDQTRLISKSDIYIGAPKVYASALKYDADEDDLVGNYLEAFTGTVDVLIGVKVTNTSIETIYGELVFRNGICVGAYT